jgi:hypothetical protein
MKLYKTSSCILLIVAIVGFAFGLCFAQSPEERPEDLSIHYHRTSGSVPPPYYHEITITVSPSGEGKILLIPDYPSESVPRWTESFSVDPSRLDALYEQIVSHKALTRSWRTPSSPSPGSPDETIQINANGRQMRIPSQIARGLRRQSRSKDDIAKAVRALVPESLWQSLNDRHMRYSMKRYPRGSE